MRLRHVAELSPKWEYTIETKPSLSEMWKMPKPFLNLGAKILQNKANKNELNKHVIVNKKSVRVGVVNKVEMMGLATARKI